MVNVLPPLTQPTHTIVIYRYCEPSRWGISHKYDFYIQQAINLLYTDYDLLPDGIRQHLILELVKTKNTHINFSQFIDQSLKDEVACRADQERLHPQYPNRSCV
jgi:hypothetical protein